VTVQARRFRDKPPLIELRTVLFVPEPPWLAWTVVRDYEAWRKFWPRMLTSEVRRDDGREAEVFTRIDVPWPLPDMDSVTRSAHERCADDIWLVRWARLSGELIENRGWSYIRPSPGGGTLVHQRILLGADVPISADFAARGARRYFHYVVRSFGEQIARARAGSWYGTEPPAPLARDGGLGEPATGASERPATGCPQPSGARP